MPNKLTDEAVLLYEQEHAELQKEYNRTYEAWSTALENLTTHSTAFLKLYQVDYRDSAFQTIANYRWNRDHAPK